MRIGVLGVVAAMAATTACGCGARMHDDPAKPAAVAAPAPAPETAPVAAPAAEPAPVAVAAPEPVAAPAPVAAPVPVAPPPPPTGTLVVSLERTSCFGTCPTYKVDVYDDGTVVWLGKANVAVTGEQRAKLTAKQMKTLVAAFKKAHFFDLDASGKRRPKPRKTADGQLEVSGDEVSCTDTPHAILTFNDGSKSQTLDDAHCGGATPLSKLEDRVDDLIGTVTWIAAPHATVNTATAAPAKVPAGPPLVSLHRRACFGRCPVYALDIYDDGTVVYTGDSDVAVTGEQRAKLSAEQLAALVQAFTDAHFFELDASGEIPPPDRYGQDGQVLRRRSPSCTDTSHAVLTFHQGKKNKTIDDAHCGGATTLSRLEDRVDEIAGTSQWVGGGDR